MNDIFPGPIEINLGDFIENPAMLRVEKSKIVDYLLNLNSKSGWGKAKFFVARGFSIEKWAALDVALHEHAETNPIASVRKNEWGIKYVVDCNIAAPNDADHCIRVVWIDHNDGKPPKLVTAHPLS